MSAKMWKSGENTELTLLNLASVKKKVVESEFVGMEEQQHHLLE